eukprot:9478649-Pyramimonas_sp.AAC.1
MGASRLDHLRAHPAPSCMAPLTRRPCRPSSPERSRGPGLSRSPCLIQPRQCRSAQSRARPWRGPGS